MEDTREVIRYELSEEEAAAIHSLAAGLIPACANVSDNSLAHISLLAHELPRTVRQVLTEFRVLERPRGAVVISGLPISEASLGPTPTVLAIEQHGPEVTLADMMLLLLASLLGDPFSHADVQEGRIVLDLCPIPGDESAQLGTGSERELAWHNEDAFHPFRADWLLLMGLRNSDEIATTFAAVPDTFLQRKDYSILFEERYPLLPDPSHLKVEHNESDPRKIAVLIGDARTPFVRIDPEFMHLDLADKAAGNALSDLVDEFDRNLQDVVLKTGEVLIIDNMRAVHGRRRFVPRYDGTDRWLRLVNVTADLRKSRGLRTGDHGRAVQ